MYLDKELVEKTRELGFNLSKTFENHLKQLISRFSTFATKNNFESSDNKWHACTENKKRGVCG